MTRLSYWGPSLPLSPSVVANIPLGTTEQQLTLSVGQPPLRVLTVVPAKADDMPVAVTLIPFL